MFGFASVLGARGCRLAKTLVWSLSRPSRALAERLEVLPLPWALPLSFSLPAKTRGGTLPIAGKDEERPRCQLIGTGSKTSGGTRGSRCMGVLGET